MKDFASYIVEQGVATHAEVLAAIDQQLKSRQPIGRIALHMGLLDSAQVFSILAHQTRHPTLRFGEAGVALGILRPRDVDTLLTEQRRCTTPLEALLVKMGAFDADTAGSLRAAYDQIPRSVRVPRPTPILRRAG
jgi:hypothetical protein